MEITAVVPCYNEQEALGLFYEELNRVTAEMRDCEFEILFVNDGSKDRTLELMKELAEKDGRVKYISFSRNFGKEAAIYAGLEHASGDLVAIMDADLQDPPRLLPEMYRAVTEEGYDSVATRRVTRKGEPPIRSFFARMFYRLMNKMCKTEVVDGARDFRLMTRPFVDSLLSMKEYNRFSKGLFGWVGFRTKWIEFENVERVAGETKWSFWKLLLYAIDGMVAFSTMPLSVAALIGILMCVIAAISIIFIIVRQLCFGGSAFGWPSMVCIMIFIGGVQLLCMGIMGQYLAKTYLEVKNRPIYICKETNIEE
ncbi:glycosyltransferase family 2 protein [Roseburia sp. BX0805]|uniref:Glycosyltransferase family 2 protein n=1 Tax=Roseburia yibonii TaxID=2763063 RepID=A0ABR7ICE8_9FIRM|nr:glycosyltransferase family 2 protein [Roseburia yibonii]MBC5754570.1 glycosyltransferase family 2 protein [Roseburia yibonii]